MVRSWQVDQGVSVDLRNRVSAEFDYTEEYKLFEKHFRNRRLGVTLGYQRGTAEFGQRSDQGHTLFVKATTVF